MIRYFYLVCLVSLSSCQLKITSFNGVDYIISPQTLNFEEAKHYCSANQATLAQLKSPEVRNWVKTAFKHTSLWIGLSSSTGKNGVFRWLDGTMPHSDIQWYDHDGCVNSLCCGVTILKASYNNLWYKQECSGKREALCQLFSKEALFQQATEMLQRLRSKLDSLVTRLNRLEITLIIGIIVLLFITNIARLVNARAVAKRKAEKQVEMQMSNLLAKEKQELNAMISPYFGTKS